MYALSQRCAKSAGTSSASSKRVKSAGAKSMSGAMPQIACAKERAAPMECVAQRHSSIQRPSTLGAGPISGKPSAEYGNTPL